MEGLEEGLGRGGKHDFDNESGGLKPDFCLRVDLAHKAHCGLSLKIININVVPVGLNNLNNIPKGGELEPHKVFDDCR